MFSVKSENILLNYFVALFSISLVLLYNLFSESLFFLTPLLILSLNFLFCGFLLFFDKYFFFKMSFLISLLVAIIYFLINSPSSFIIIVVLFICLSQICNILSYFVLFSFLLLTTEIFEVYLVIGILALILVFSILFGLRKLREDFYSNLFYFEGRHSVFRHNIANLCSVLFFKNKDKSLAPFLEEIRESLNTEGYKLRNANHSIAGILRISIYFLNYDYNLRVKNNFRIEGEDLLWICFFYNLLEKFGKIGSTILIEEMRVTVYLSNFSSKDLDDFVKNQLIAHCVNVEGNVLQINYGR